MFYFFVLAILGVLLFIAHRHNLEESKELTVSRKQSKSTVTRETAGVTIPGNKSIVHRDAIIKKLFHPMNISVDVEIIACKIQWFSAKISRIDFAVDGEFL